AEAASQLLQAQAHAALDGADGGVEHLGDLRMREAAEVGERDHLALLVGQLVERRTHRRRLVAARDLDVGALARLEAFLQTLVAGAPAVVHERAPQRIDRAVVDDAEHPGAHAAPSPVVARAAAPQGEERLLRDVLGDAALAAHPVRKGVGGVGVALVDDLEGRGVATAGELHEVLVGQAAEARLARGLGGASAWHATGLYGGRARPDQRFSAGAAGRGAACAPPRRRRAAPA